jgi:hypothetical protein
MGRLRDHLLWIVEIQHHCAQAGSGREPEEDRVLSAFHEKMWRSYGTAFPPEEHEQEIARLGDYHNI